MKKLYILIALIVAISYPSFAYDSIEAVIEAHYAADLTGDIDRLLATMNLDYINENLADEATYRAYIEGNRAVYKSLEASVSNIKYDLSDDGSMALARYDVVGKFEVIETGAIFDLSKNVGAYLEKTDSGWLINFTMDADLMTLKLEAGATELVMALTESLALEDAARPVFEQEDLKTEYESALASLNDFNEAAAPPETTEPLPVPATESSNEDSGYDFEKIIAEQEAKHRTKTIMTFLIPVLIIGGGAAGFFWYKKNRQK